MVGVAEGRPRADRLDRQALGARRRSTVQTGAWPTGLYAARLTTDDGRVGFAPFVLRASDPRRCSDSSS